MSTRCGNGSPCVLVVDDYRDNQEVIRKLLQLKGYATSGASTGGEAIQLIDERCTSGDTCPDLVILDVDLPDIRGGTLGKWIRQVYPAIPFIFLTAYGRPPAIEEIAQSLRAPLLQKPIDGPTLLEAVRRELQDYKARRQVGTPLVVPEVMREHIEAVKDERDAAKAATGEL